MKLKILVVIVFVSGLLQSGVLSPAMAQTECQSVLVTNEKLKQRFNKNMPGYEVILDDTFDDNSYKWPVGWIKGKKGKARAEVKNGVYRIKFSGAVSPQLHVSRPAELSKKGKEYFIEACFRFNEEKIKASKTANKDIRFGLIWHAKLNGVNEADRSSRKDKHLNDSYSYFSTLRDGKVSARGNKPGAGALKDFADNIHPNGAWNGIAVITRNHAEKTHDAGGLNGSPNHHVSSLVKYRADRIGFEFYSNTQAEIEITRLTITAIDRPKPKPPALRDKADIYRELKSKADPGPFLNIKGAVLDVKTNLCWSDTSYMTEHKYPPTKFSSIQNWADSFNKKFVGGLTGWRIPRVDEYPSLYSEEKYARGFKPIPGYIEHGPLGYPFGIHGRAPLALSTDREGRYVRVFDFKKGNKSAVDWPKDHFWERLVDSLLVTCGPLDLFYLLKDPGHKGTILSREQAQIMERVTAAQRAGLTDAAGMLLETLISQSGPSLFRLGFTRQIADQDLALSLAGKVLLAAKSTHGNTARFWYEAAHLAVLANQPALVLKAAKQLRQVPPVPEFKEEILDHAAVFEAIAYMLLEQTEKAYTSLLMRFELKKNIIIPSYVNGPGSVLLKDKKRLATVLGIDEKLLVGKYNVPTPQDFYNMETGQLVRVVVTAPRVEKPSTAAPSQSGAGHNIRQSGDGATVLD